MKADDKPAASFDLFDVAHGGFVQVGLRDGRHEDLRKHVFVNQRNRAMFHEAARHPFGVLVGHFLHFQRGLHADCHVDAAPQKEPVFDWRVGVGNVLNAA